MNKYIVSVIIILLLIIGALLSLRPDRSVKISFNSEDVDILIRTVIGEAGNQSSDGQVAVIHTIVNRVIDGRFGGRTIKAVCMANNGKVYQFETWQNPARRAMLMRVRKNGSQYKKIYKLVVDVLLGRRLDNTRGSLYYLSPKIVMNRFGRLPHCKNNNKTNVTIGDHRFCQ